MRNLCSRIFAFVLVSFLAFPPALSAADAPGPNPINCSGFNLGDRVNLVSFGNFLYRLTPSGWQRLVLPETWRQIAVPDDQTIYIVGDKTLFIYRSDDGGRTWLKAGALPAGVPDFGAFWPSPDPNTYLATFYDSAGRHSHLWKSGDGGKTWHIVLDFSGWFLGIGPLVFSPAFATDHTAFLATFGKAAFEGVQRTTDGGETWPSAPNAGMPYPSPFYTSYFLNISPQFAQDGTLFSAGVTDGAGYYRSRNRADSWTTLADDHPSALALSPEFAVDQTLLLADQANGLSVSHDAGDTVQKIWTRPSPPVAIGLSKNPGAGYPFVYRAIVSDGSFCQLYRSTDGGATWEGESVYAQLSQARLPLIGR